MVSSLFTTPSNIEGRVKIMMSRAIPDYEQSLEETKERGFTQPLIPTRISGVFSDHLARRLGWNHEFVYRNQAFRAFEQRMEEYIFQDQHVKVTVKVSNLVAGDDLSEPLWGWMVTDVEGYVRPGSRRTPIRDFFRGLFGGRIRLAA